MAPAEEQYIAHLQEVADDVLLVSAADKLHNARSIVADFQQHGATIWIRFKGGKSGTLWYYRKLARVFNQRASAWIYEELDRVVTELESMIRASGTSSDVKYRAHTKDQNGNVRCWWQALPAVPVSPSTRAYQRLRRVCWDPNEVPWN